METDIQKHLFGIYSAMRSRINLINKSIGHAATQGAENENEIKDLLLDFLPPKYGIGSGVIIGTDGKQSKQIDIVVFDKDRANYSLSGSSKIFFADHVIAAIEIKTTYASGEKSSLTQAFENISSVKALKVTQKKWIDTKFNQTSKKLEFIEYSPTPPIGIVFFFGAPDRNTCIDSNEFIQNFKRVAAAFPSERHPDLLFSLHHAFFFRYGDIAKKSNENQSFSFSLVQTDDNKSNVVSMDGLTDESIAVASFADVRFTTDKVHLSAQLFNSTRSHHIHSIGGDRLNTDPIVYKVVKAGESYYLLDHFRAFIIFVFSVEKLLSIKKTSSVWSPEDYYGSTFFLGSEYDIDLNIKNKGII